MAEPAHPVLAAVRPLLDRIGAAVVGPADLLADDVPLVWDGEIVAGIRLSAEIPVDGADRHPGGADRAAQSADPIPGPAGRSPGRPDPATVTTGGSAVVSEAAGGLDGIIVELERSLGTPLAELTRSGKQQAVRLLEEAGAFSYRKSVEVVAAALGVSRFTVYNYLNRDRD